MPKYRLVSHCVLKSGNNSRCVPEPGSSGSCVLETWSPGAVSVMSQNLRTVAAVYTVAFSEPEVIATVQKPLHEFLLRLSLLCRLVTPAPWRPLVRLLLPLDIDK